MSSLDHDQHLHPSCRDKTTVTSDSSDAHELAKQPLQGLKLASHAVLEEAQQKGRLKCSKCGGSRMFFCYTCCSLVGVTPQDIPLIKLPVKIDIIKHPNETDGKSTAIHAKILAPSDVNIYTYPCIPDYENEKRVVFIDSTWNQTNKISTDERLQDLLQVELKMRKTCFWRHQKGKPDTYLATIEAIYYFLKDFHEHCLAQEYNGEYDNILFFYSYLRSVVSKAKTSAQKC
ncbi:DTW domain-containing protein 1 [Collichthys lucidus]|uniref:tRNA-uridine aminocarboxypropyltransferase 1 n=1 Tax=Collichthys lucidus TaxID=240159 RepID=A0A4U5U969_COLLU|nr:DTW domain-containing protein 1 [Collichthys lucidus]